MEEIATGRRFFIVWKVLDEVIDPDQQQTVEWEKPVAVYNVEHKNLKN